MKKFKKFLKKNFSKYKFIILIIALIVINLIVVKSVVSFREKSDKILVSLIKEEKDNIFIYNSNYEEITKLASDNKIILLNIFDIDNPEINSIIEKMSQLNQKHRGRISIIDIVPIKGDYQTNDNIIVNYIIQNNISRPIINLSEKEIKKRFKIESSSGIIILDLEGRKFNKYENPIDIKLIKNDIEKLILKKIKIAKTFNEKEEENLLIKSLTRLNYSNKFKYSSQKNVLFISDSKGRKVFVVSLNGKIIYQIGSGKKGMRDGELAKASFCKPQGLSYKNNLLYVADACNNAIRKIDFKKQEVSTLVKDDNYLMNITDVTFFPSSKKLVASGKNPHGIVSLNKKGEKITAIIEKSLENRNITKILQYDDKLYFLDSDKNTIYNLDKKEKTNEFLNLENDPIYISNFHIDDTGIYIVDKYDHKIFKTNNENDKLEIYSGGGYHGNMIGNIKKTKYNNPGDIIAIRDRLYIADNNNYRIVQIDKNENQTSSISIYPNSFSKGLDELNGYLNNTTFKKKKKFAFNQKGEITLNIGDNFKFAKDAPNALYIFKQEKNNAILVKSYSIKEIKSKKLTIPKLEKNQTYYIKGAFYYCEDKESSPCLIKKYQKKIIVNKNKGEVKNLLNIDF